MSSVVGADVVSSFNAIPQGTLECVFHHRAPLEVRGLACGVPTTVSHWLPLEARHDLLGEAASLGRGQFSREEPPVTPNSSLGMGASAGKRDLGRGPKDYKGIILEGNRDSEASILLIINTKLSTTWKPQRRQKADRSCFGGVVAGEWLSKRYLLCTPSLPLMWQCCHFH